MKAGFHGGQGHICAAERLKYVFEMQLGRLPMMLWGCFFFGILRQL